MSKKYQKLTIGLVVVLLVGFIGYGVHRYYPKHNQINQTKISQPTPKVIANKSQTNQAKVSHIFIIMDENQPYANIVGNPSAPYLNYLINKYSLATNYFAITHPSLPNYLAVTSGSTDGITTDCNPPSAGCEVSVDNIANQIVASGRTWREYAESMPSNCYTYNDGNYATKHNPFIYYSNIINNKSYCQEHVVPYNQLANNLQHLSTTPDYAFITPNLCNDMHNCSISSGDDWLKSNVPVILNSKAFTEQKSLLVITWDEGYVGDNHIATIFAGSAAKLHYQSNSSYNHYSLLHTIEYLWDLKPLTSNVQKASLMTNLLK